MNAYGLERDEPLFADPNALLRRMVRDGSLADGALLDPWGGTIDSYSSNGPRIPFITVRGFALHAPGPDGVAARPTTSTIPSRVCSNAARLTQRQWAKFGLSMRSGT